MMRISATTLAIVCFVPAIAGAHRLDEYLQATRVAVSRDHIAIELDLTPGANVASEIVALIDRDRDGRITPAEAHAYGRSVLSDIVLMLDGRELRLTLIEVDVPPIGRMLDGMGAIGIEASAAVTNRVARSHSLFYRNNHRSGSSVYAVNALMPDTRGVSIGRQRRDARQQEFRLEYEIAGLAAVEWTLAAALLLAGLVFTRCVAGFTRCVAGAPSSAARSAYALSASGDVAPTTVASSAGWSGRR